MKSTRFILIFLCCLVIACDQSKVGNTEEASIAVAATTASHNGAWLKAAQLYEQLYVQELSKEEWNYQAGTNYLRANYPKKALSILTNFDEKHLETSSDFNGRIARIAKAHYQLGDFKKVEAVAKNYVYPKMYRGLAREHLKALIQLDKVADLATYFSNYQEQGIYDDKGKKTNTGFLYRAICNELLIVGNSNLLKDYAAKYHQWANLRKPADKRNLAIAKFYQQDYPQAISSLQEAISIEDSPRHRMELVGLLGVSYAKHKEFKKAYAQIQKISTLDELPVRHDSFGAKFYHQARIEVALNQKEKAIHSLEKAVAAKAAFWSNRFKEDGLMRDLFGDTDFEGLIIKARSK